MTKVKICGITNFKDAEYCITCGADFLGFVFYKKSKRFIAPKAAADIINKLSLRVLKVGIFVNEAPDVVKEIAENCCLDYLQFHGDETRAYLKNFKTYKIIRAIRIEDKTSFDAAKLFEPEIFLFDTFKKEVFGGSGDSFDWGLLKSLKGFKKSFMISGGLTPENVKELLAWIKPFGVDVSSGVESEPGKKDYRLVKRFIETVKHVA